MFLPDGGDDGLTSDDLASCRPNPGAIEQFKLIANNRVWGW